jgi:Cu-processing system permease protein
MALTYFTKDSSRAVVSLLNIILVVTPLFSLIFTITYIYNSRALTELILVFPVKRSTIFWLQYAGVTITLVLALIWGLSLPFLLTGFTPSLVTLISSGIILTCIFTSFAFLFGSIIEDKVRGIGFSLACWLYFCIIYDMLVVAVYKLFSNYPLETATIVMGTLNPVDLTRIFILLQLDISALMGYTGAVLKYYFGSYSGIIFSAVSLMLWLLLPLLTALKFFRIKDF